jgi:hypothetical protein
MESSEIEVRSKSISSLLQCNHQARQHQSFRGGTDLWISRQTSGLGGQRSRTFERGASWLFKKQETAVREH